MKKGKAYLQIFLMVLLITAAFASAAFALRPLLFNLDKTQEIKRENVQFYMNADALQEIAKEADKEDGLSFNTFHYVTIVGTNQRIAEVP